MELMQLFGKLVDLEELLRNGCKILHHNETADDIGDIQERIVGLFLGSRQIIVMLQLILIAHGVIFRLQMIPFFFQLSQMLTALIQRLDGLPDILRTQLINRAAIVHGTAISLRINLQNSTAKSGFAAAGLAYQTEGFTLVDFQVDTIIGFYIHPAFFQREPLLQIADAEQNFFII